MAGEIASTYGMANATVFTNKSCAVAGFVLSSKRGLRDHQRNYPERIDWRYKSHTEHALSLPTRLIFRRFFRNQLLRSVRQERGSSHALQQPTCCPSQYELT